MDERKEINIVNATKQAHYEAVFGSGTDNYGRKLSPTKGCPAHAEASDQEEYNHAKPPHYEMWDGIEDSFAMHRAVLTHEEYLGFLKGNIFKYKLRLGDKPDTPVEIDLAKIKTYREELKKTNKIKKQQKYS